MTHSQLGAGFISKQYRMFLSTPDLEPVAFALRTESSTTAPESGGLDLVGEVIINHVPVRAQGPRRERANFVAGKG